MSNRFAADLREGYLQVAGCLTAQDRALVARARDLINVDPVERNRCLAQIVGFYRVGSKEVWGPVLLDLMAPTLVLMLAGFGPMAPVIDEEEIRQQVVAEALHASARIPLHERGLQTRFRIASRTYTNMLRWLARESRHRQRHSSYETQVERLQ